MQAYAALNKRQLQSHILVKRHSLLISSSFFDLHHNNEETKEFDLHHNEEIKERKPTARRLYQRGQPPAQDQNYILTAA